MTEKLKKFYNELYAKDPYIFGDSSYAWVCKAMNGMKNEGGNVVDIGAGQGMVSRYFAEQGYVVDAVDISDIVQGLRNDRIQVFSQAIEDFVWEKMYEIVHIALVLHHIKKEEAVRVIKNAQEHTRPGGLHILRVFTGNSDFAKSSDGSFFFDQDGAIDTLYASWKEIKNEVTQAKAATVEMKNEIRHVVFQKNGD